jgi:glycosyltransferase involved in cell wall biosynthesis
MKILYIISTVNSKAKGIGGHYYSLLTTANALSKIHDVHIIHIGPFNSVALSDTELKLDEIISPKYNMLFIFRKLNELVKEIKPDILHSFDIPSHFFSRIISFKNKIPNILTKCGGENPKVYFPFTSNLILFSKENEIYFANSNKFRKTKIYLIPNRVSKIKVDDKRINELKQIVDLTKYDYVILRITRIGYYYKNVNTQLVNLFKELREKDINCCLLFIGTVENIEVKDLLLEETEHLYVISESRFTTNAKALIGVADIVHGTGRSFMEASSYSKIMLVPTANLKYPVLFKKENYIDILNQNISGRYVEKYNNDEQTISEIIDLLKNKNNQKEIKEFTKNVYNQYFNIASVIKKYNEIYSNLKYIKSIKFIDFMLNYLYIKKLRLRG